MMHANRIRDSKPRDSVGRARTRGRVVHGTLWVLLAVVLLAGGGWLLFWSPVFAVRDVVTEGVPAAAVSAVKLVVEQSLARRLWGLVPFGRNALFSRTTSLKATITSQIPELQDVSVVRDGLHAISVNARLRMAVGVWCRSDVCQYWDESGAFWGSALPSTGPLLLMVEDDRAASDSADTLVGSIVTAVADIKSIGITARKVMLPNAEPGGLRITTAAGYDLLMDGLGDIADQVDTLTLFLADRAKDSTFHPAYIDLRTPGRVYFK